jgi:hypothetical protein
MKYSESEIDKATNLITILKQEGYCIDLDSGFEYYGITNVIDYIEEPFIKYYHEKIVNYIILINDETVMVKVLFESDNTYSKILECYAVKKEIKIIWTKV